MGALLVCAPPAAGSGREYEIRAGPGVRPRFGVSCVKPAGSLYVFPRLDPERYPIKDDQLFVLDFLREQRVLLVQGTGFSFPTPDHFRIVTLPHQEDLVDAIARLGSFLSTYDPMRSR